jgi:predicted MFS family arabinose efflux permease
MVGEGLCFLLNAISFVAVIASLLAMRLPKFVPQKRESPWPHLVGGFRYAYGQPAIRALLVMVAAASLSGMPALVLLPFFADDIFHQGAQGLGFLTGGMGIGAVIGTLVLARRARTSGLVEVIFLGAMTFGASFLVLAGSPSFYLALAIMPVIGFSIMRHNAAANTLIQVLIPDEYRGRIMALYSMTVVGIGPFGSLATGALAGRFGARVTVMCGGILCLIAATFFRLYVRKLRELK